MAAVFQTTFSNAFLKFIDFEEDFTECYSHESIQQYSSIVPDNGLAPARRQAIIWTNYDYFTDAYMRHSAPAI